MIGGILRTYPNFTMEDVLHNISYANLMMFSAVLPSYDSEEKCEKEKKKGMSNKGLYEALKKAKG